MIPQISEFSYGFALTRELTNLAGPSLTAAPIFPTQVAEGRIGGGFDVHLDLPGIPLFLQFKRADCMTLPTAKQITQGIPLKLPFYRYALMNYEPHDQHELLLDLDRSPNWVLYASPKFHLVAELNNAYVGSSLADHSLFVRPSSIGRLPYGTHTIAYDHHSHYVCSEPREIATYDGSSLFNALATDLQTVKVPLSELAQGVLGAVKDALHSATTEPISFGEPPDEDEGDAKRVLRTVSDIAQRYLSAQFFVVQWK